MARNADSSRRISDGGEEGSQGASGGPEAEADEVVTGWLEAGGHSSNRALIRGSTGVLQRITGLGSTTLVPRTAPGTLGPGAWIHAGALSDTYT